MNKSYFFIALLSLLLFSCYSIPDRIEPKISYVVQDKYIKSLPSPFTPLTKRELHELWGQEYLIGIKFAKELDLYRAITSFKRAQFLITEEDEPRLLEIQYNMLLCYYLGQKFDEVIEVFSHSNLPQARASFPAYHDLLVIMYESYKETKQSDKAARVFAMLEKDYPQTAKKLKLATALTKGNIDDLTKLSKDKYDNHLVKKFLSDYEKEKKSVRMAQNLNILPGAGYLYVGQRQSAITAFLFNSLFIAATVFFFKEGNIPAGIVTASLEVGWYFGGIYGAGEAAKLYNERIYEGGAYLMMNREKLAPAFMLNYAF